MFAAGASTPPAPKYDSRIPMRAPERALGSRVLTKLGSSLPSSIAVAGSAGSAPIVASSAIAKSSILLASGPPRLGCEIEGQSRQCLKVLL